MNRRTLLALLIITGVCAAPRAAHAATGPASVYKVTITQFEIYNGTSWITVSDGSSTTIDIASVQSSSVAGTFFSGLSVPDGTYTQVRVTVSGTFVISGRVGSSYTTAVISNGGCVVTAVAANEAECTVTASLPAPTPDVLPTALTVTNGVPSHKIRVTFNVNTALEDTGFPGTIIPGQPSVTMTMVAL